MILAALIGCFAAYYFGLRIGAYVAAAAFLLDVAAFFLPRYATALHSVIAVGIIAIWRLGSRRPVPASSTLAVHWLRNRAGRVLELIWPGDDDGPQPR